ncbi:hypothetical protein G3N95_05295 [Paraburkholderia sp. Tr-20389]|nr:hypothetical protein [Paraburkholderia sp. Tr-20389]
MLASVRVAADSDMHFACTNPPNSRAVRLAARWQPSPDIAGVYRTGIAGLGIRIRAKGGSFAGIDDAARDVPYEAPLPGNADKLTGFSVQVDFIKTGVVQDGTIEAGPLLSVTAGGVELADVSMAGGSVAVAARQCDGSPRASGAITTGVGTMGSFSQEALMLSGGCGVVVSAVIETGSGYRFGNGAGISAKTNVQPRAPAGSWASAPVVGGLDMFDRTSGGWSRDDPGVGSMQNAGRTMNIRR